MRAKVDFLYVKCLYCKEGIAVSKCASTMSTHICGNCGKAFWAYVKDGIVTTGMIDSPNGILPSEKRLVSYFNGFENMLEDMNIKTGTRG